MICDKLSTFAEGVTPSAGAIIGDAMDLGATYNIGAGANHPPYLVINTEGKITSAGVLTLNAVTIDPDTKAITKGDVLMTIPVSTTEDADMVFAGILPAIPKASGNGIALYCSSAPTGAKLTAQIVSQPPVHHIYADLPR